MGYFGIFAITLWVEAPHFRFEKDFNFYLILSRAILKVGISVSLQQAGENSKLKTGEFIFLIC